MACAQPPGQGHLVSLGPRASETSPCREREGRFRAWGQERRALGGATPARSPDDRTRPGARADPPSCQRAVDPCVQTDMHLPGRVGSPLAAAVGAPGCRDSSCPGLLGPRPAIRETRINPSGLVSLVMVPAEFSAHPTNFVFRHCGHFLLTWNCHRYHRQITEGSGPPTWEFVPCPSPRQQHVPAAQETLRQHKWRRPEQNPYPAR